MYRAWTSDQHSANGTTLACRHVKVLFNTNHEYTILYGVVLDWVLDWSFALAHRLHYGVKITESGFDSRHTHHFFPLANILWMESHSYRGRKSVVGHPVGLGAGHVLRLGRHNI